MQRKTALRVVHFLVVVNVLFVLFMFSLVTWAMLYSDEYTVYLLVSSCLVYYVGSTLFTVWLYITYVAVLKVPQNKPYNILSEVQNGWLTVRPDIRNEGNKTK